MKSRNIYPKLLAATKDTPAILINGPRQSGKTTLIKELQRSGVINKYYSLDDTINLTAALSSPEDFISNMNYPVAIDEVQRAPEIFLAIKSSIDKKRKPGKFILTGSANISLLPKISESLAGRIEILKLYPFSQGELDGTKEGFIDLMFSNKKLPLGDLSEISRRDLNRRIEKGGFPDVQKRSKERADGWFGSYVNSILSKDVRDISNVDGLKHLPTLTQLLAVRSMNILNMSELSVSTQIKQTTLSRYITLLEAVFLVNFLKPYSGNLSKRLLKTPKVFFVDTGVMSYLTGFDITPQISGQLLENFVLCELIKQSTWSKNKISFYYYRDIRGSEIDIILENRAGELIAIEIKKSLNVDDKSFNAIREFKAEVKSKFKRGIVLYTGSEPVSFGKDLFALPVNSIWQLGATKQ